MAGNRYVKEKIREDIEKYEKEIDRHEIEIGKLRAKVEALKAIHPDLCAEAASVPVLVPNAKQRIKRGELKSTVLALLEERGSMGLNANLVAEITSQRGFPVDRNSASSLLSKLKDQGVVNYDDKVYRLHDVKDASEADRVH